MQSKHISAPELCTGCGLCANICPKDAISMIWSEDGFAIPKVNTNTCIECGLCVKYCIANTPRKESQAKLSEVKSYAAWSGKTEIHNASSSGGVFSALASATLKQGGVVFGVVWQNNHTAIFSKANSEAELAAMRGSKYTQALPGLIYRDAKQELQNGRRVLFAGTPCQVHALKQYLRKDYDNLLTLDVICHGVPSHLILEKYVTEIEGYTHRQVKHINFRDNQRNWNNYSVTCHFTNGEKQSTPKDNDNYMLLFLSDQALQKSCYTCPYARIPRQGDISVGDYWGVSPEHHPDWPIQKGISAILANTEKGLAALLCASKNESLQLHSEPFRHMYRWQKHSYINTKTRRGHKRQGLISMLKGTYSLTQCVDHYAYYFYKGPICLNKRGYIFRVLKALKNTLKNLTYKLKR